MCDWNQDFYFILFEKILTQPLVFDSGDFFTFLVALAHGAACGAQRRLIEFLEGGEAQTARFL